MIHGIETFKRHFQGHENKYVLIGGSACDLVMSDAGAPFRATNDLDIVFCIEVIDKGFIDHFFSFIAAGDYKWLEKREAHNHFFRFFDPEKPQYPSIIEIFSRQSKHLPATTHKAKLIVEGEEVMSLSAILLRADYYDFIHANTATLEDIPVVNEKALILLKACAWVSNTTRKSAGETVRTVDIDKHREDIYRLATLLTPAETIELPLTLKNDMHFFLANARPINTAERLQWGWANRKDGEVETMLKSIFMIND